MEEENTRHLLVKEVTAHLLKNQEKMSEN